MSSKRFTVIDSTETAYLAITHLLSSIPQADERFPFVRTFLSHFELGLALSEIIALHNQEPVLTESDLELVAKMLEFFGDDYDLCRPNE
jgi:hypothetical protein